MDILHFKQVFIAKYTCIIDVVIFSNFLHELENCQDMPAKVGTCFANRVCYINQLLNMKHF